MKAKYLFSAVALFLIAGCSSAEAAGTVIGWGQNTNGQTTIPDGLVNIQAITAGSDIPTVTAGTTGFSLALKPDGTVVGWGSNAHQQTNIPITATNITAIAAGEYHAVALRADGKVFAWGFDNLGQTNVPASLASNVVAIAAGGSAGDHSLALKSDGTVVAWGNNANHQTNVPPNLTNVVAIAAGSQHSLALKSDGTVIAWGFDNFNQTNVPPSATNLVAIAAGSFHCLGLKTNGTVIAWGDNNNTQTNVPLTATNIVAIAAGEQHSMALRRDGTILVWGNTNAYMFDLPGGISNVIAITSSARHALAIVGDGTPGITVPPRDQSIYPGSMATFLVMAAGPGTLAYQWKFNDVNISGATGPVLLLTNVQPAKSGSYQVTVRNSFGVTSASAGLTLLDGRLSFVQQPPASATLGVSSNLTLSVSLSGATPMNFQWLKNGSPISSKETNSSYTISNAQTNDSGGYSVMVSNNYSSVLSTTDNISVVYFKPTNVNQTGSANIALGNNFTLRVTEDGTAPFSWQWRTNGIPIIGATNNTYLISNAQFTDAGLYDVVITNLGGSVTSSVIIVTVGYVEGPISNPANGHKYFIVNPGSWTVARTEAQALGGDLVTIRNATENSWIVANLLINYSSVKGPDLSRAPLWIGMIDPITNDGGGGSQHVTDFVWADGETTTYRHWNSGTGEPNNNGNFEYYGAISWQWAAGGGNETQGTWNDVGLNGTSFAGGTSGNGIGPYYGIAEIGGSAVSLTIRMTNSLITITPVPSLAGQVIQTTTNLAPAQWDPVWTNDGTSAYTFTPDANNRFFRLVH